MWGSSMGSWELLSDCEMTTTADINLLFAVVQPCSQASSLTGSPALSPVIAISQFVYD